MKRLTILLMSTIWFLCSCQSNPYIRLPTKFRGGQMYAVWYDTNELKWVGDPKQGSDDLRLRSIVDGPAKVSVGRHYNQPGKNFLFTYTIENNKVIDLEVTGEDR